MAESSPWKLSSNAKKIDNYFHIYISHFHISGDGNLYRLDQRKRNSMVFCPRTAEFTIDATVLVQCSLLKRLTRSIEKYWVQFAVCLYSTYYISCFVFYISSSTFSVRNEMESVRADNKISSYFILSQPLQRHKSWSTSSFYILYFIFYILYFKFHN